MARTSPPTPTAPPRYHTLIGFLFTAATTGPAGWSRCPVGCSLIGCQRVGVAQLCRVLRSAPLRGRGSGAPLSSSGTRRDGNSGHHGGFASTWTVVDGVEVHARVSESPRARVADCLGPRLGGVPPLPDADRGAARPPTPPRRARPARLRPQRRPGCGLRHHPASRRPRRLAARSRDGARCPARQLLRLPSFSLWRVCVVSPRRW